MSLKTAKSSALLVQSMAPLLALVCAILQTACKANTPSATEEKIAAEAKKMAIRGKDWKNPIADNQESVSDGSVHFLHHCQVCHGLDGQNTGVPFADKMFPPVADLRNKDVQDYTDGQMKWIIENGIRYSGMPGWKGVLSDQEMWNIVHYLRHLPQKGSLGIPPVFSESKQEHQANEKPFAQPGTVK